MEATVFAHTHAYCMPCCGYVCAQLPSPLIKRKKHVNQPPIFITPLCPLLPCSCLRMLLTRQAPSSERLCWIQTRLRAS